MFDTLAQGIEITIGVGALSAMGGAVGGMLMKGGSYTRTDLCNERHKAVDEKLDRILEILDAGK